MNRLTYTVDEVSEALGCSAQHIRNLINRHELPAVRVGQRVLVSVKALDHYLEQQAIPAPAAPTPLPKRKQASADIDEARQRVRDFIRQAAE